MNNDIQNCDPLNIFMNVNTGQLECLPGVLIPPPGYTQLIPAVDVSPKNNNWKYVMAVIIALMILKK